jgi:hypothetical protein
LPEVVITDIKNTLTDADPDLTFALNFAIKDVDKLSEEYLEKLFAKYGDYYTDYVLTISGLTDPNGSVKFNANGNGDGYLAGQPRTGHSQIQRIRLPVDAGGERLSARRGY